jgi:hypothetical protein
MPSYKRFALATAAVLASAAVGTALSAPAPAQNNQNKLPVPDFSSENVSWTAINSDFTPVEGSPAPVSFDPEHPFFRNDQARDLNVNATYRVPNPDNPNLKPWAQDVLRKQRDTVLGGAIGPTPRWSCMPGSVPGFSLFVVEPVYVVQGPRKVLLIYQGNQEVRHVYLNARHSQNPKPSWYGESVGHYEGDTLVVDTIGITARAPIDNYHTPHTDQLHVVERYRVVDDGKALQVDLTIEDPGTFNEPWKARQRYSRTMQGPLPEVKCSENNDDFFNLRGFVGSPTADKPDF